MKERLIETDKQRLKACEDIMKLDLPIVIGVAREVTRSKVANARYWATLDEHLRQVNLAINEIADYSGNSNIAVRKQIAQNLDDESLMLLYQLDRDGVHKALKLINGVDTTTRLSKSYFQKFEGRMEAALMNLLGEVRAFAADCR